MASAGVFSAGSGGQSEGGFGGSAAGNAGVGGDAGSSGGASGAAGKGGSSSGGAGGAAGAAGSSGAGGGGKGGSGGAGGGGGSGGSTATQTCAKNPITAKSKWVITASASNTPDPPAQASDNLLTTRWSTGKDQAGGEWLQLDFGAVVTLTRLTLALGPNANDFPRGYQARFSNTAMNGAAPIRASGAGAAGVDTIINFPAGTSGRYVLVSQTGSVSGLWWSVAELEAECAD